MAKFNFIDFFEKIRFRYKISILNENTLGEVWFAHLSRLRVFLLAFLVFVVIFFISFFLIFNTPLRKVMPGYMDSELQSKLITKSLYVDSMHNELAKQRSYITNIVSLMRGDIKIDNMQQIDSVMKERESFVEKTKQEKKFAENFEADEKYNLSVLDVKQNNDVIFFCPPANGIIKEKFRLKQHYGIDIITAANESARATADGVVVFTGYTIDEGYIIVVQHRENFISIYKDTSELLKRVGDQVRIGEAIAITGKSESKKESGLLHFELWQNGKPLNPEHFIVF